MNGAKGNLFHKKEEFLLLSCLRLAFGSLCFIANSNPASKRFVPKMLFQKRQLGFLGVFSLKTFSQNGRSFLEREAKPFQRKNK